MYLIDTNILSLLIREAKNVQEYFLKHSNEIKLCSLVKAKCYYGAKKINSKNLIQVYNYIFETYPILNFNGSDAEIFVDLKIELEKLGKVVEDFDLMIASICLTNNLTLVTNNTKHFTNIPNLKLEDWSKS